MLVVYIENDRGRIERFRTLSRCGTEVRPWQEGEPIDVDSSSVLLLRHATLRTSSTTTLATEIAGKGGVAIDYSGGAFPDLDRSRDRSKPFVLSWQLLGRLFDSLPDGFQSSDIRAGLEKFRRAPYLRAAALLCWVACEVDRRGLGGLQDHDLGSAEAWRELFRAKGKGELLLAATGQADPDLLGDRWPNLASLIGWIYPQADAPPGRPNFEEVLWEIEQNEACRISSLGK